MSAEHKLRGIRPVQVKLAFPACPGILCFMNLEAFKTVVSCPVASLPLQALWHDSHGDWERAHALCQEAKSCDGDWVHAYLHRKEGDASNAGYWYARAGRPLPSASLEAEWTVIVSAFLK